MATDMAGNSNGMSNSGYAVTFHGLHQWVKHEFEHYGWMLLAAQRDDEHSKNKVKLYKESVDTLMNAIMTAISGTGSTILGTTTVSNIVEADRIRDLNILLDEVKVLKANLSNLVQKSITGGNKKKNNYKKKDDKKKDDDKRKYWIE